MRPLVCFDGLHHARDLLPCEAEKELASDPRKRAAVHPLLLLLLLSRQSLMMLALPLPRVPNGLATRMPLLVAWIRKRVKSSR